MIEITGNLLKRYDDREFVMRLKARFIAQCYIVELAAILVATLYTGYAHLHNPIYGFKLHFQTFGVLIGGFALSILGLVILVRGYYTISANLLILIGFATAWTVIITDQTHVVSRLDTIVFVIGLLCMMPIVILERPYCMVFYAGINILVLYGFMFLMRDDLNLPYASFISYLADNTVMILVVATISYQISMINRRALEKAERDIVVRKRAEAAKDEALQRYQALFKSKTTLVFIMDEQGYLVEANDLALDLFGYDNEELRRLSYFQLLHPDQDPEPIAMTILEILESGAQTEPLEIKLKSKNGKTIYIQSGGVLIPGKNEIIGVARDITDQKTAEEVRKKLEAQLIQAQKMEAIGQLAGGIAHDFNNIMAVIILYAEMLARSEELTERDQEKAAVIKQQGRHATRLIQQILDFSRQAVLEQRPLDLLPLLKEQVKLLERTLPEHIEITLAHGEEECMVSADLTRMRQMMMNLALNARDAMPGGGTLCISLEEIEVQPSESPLLPEMEAGEWIRLTVSDTGTGIAPDVLPHIFDPFFTTKAQGEGTGLGLAQVEGIVDQHRGRIGVTTEVGKGTTFTIYLPALTVRPVELPTADVSTMPQGGGEVVLVVEDGEAVRVALVKSLEQMNYQTLEAANGEQALALMQERGERVALVLSDVVMPVMGGVRLLHALRQQGWETPVILLTGYAVRADFDKLRAQGLSAWLPKPPSSEQLAQAIARALG